MSIPTRFGAKNGVNVADSRRRPGMPVRRTSCAPEASCSLPIRKRISRTPLGQRTLEQTGSSSLSKTATPTENSTYEVEARTRHQHNELVNSVTHGIGAILAVIGFFALLERTNSDTMKTIAFVLYGGTMIVLYLASTALHSYHIPSRTRRILRRLDHVAIYLYIAGTHTPLCLITLGDQYGWALLGTVWTLAGAGVLFKLFYLDASRWLSMATYLATGWIAVLLLWPLSQVMPGEAIFWLVLGGFFYTVGSMIYLLRRPNPWPGKFAHHEIWHCAVLAGSACHYYMMLEFVA